MNQFARPGLAVTQLPSFNENDKGKVLTINSESGALGWEEGSGGGGSGGGVLVLHEDESGALDKTWQEIADSDLCILNYYGAKMIQYGVAEPIGQGKYKVFFWDFYESSQAVYEADSPTDYPVYVEEP